jgi:RimK family alpha-L-glutamate ligase
MRVAVVGEPTGWHVGRLTEALVHRGHGATVVPWAELAGGVESGRETLLPRGLDEADVVAIRGMPGTAPTAPAVPDGGFTTGRSAAGGFQGHLERVVFRMDLLGRLAARGTPVVNSPRSLETAIDKYLSLARLAAAGIPVPRSRVVQTPGAAEKAWAELGGDCVLKPLFGSRGRGLRRFSGTAELLTAVTAGDQSGGVTYLQEFIPHGGWDVRILTVGSQTFSMRRIAPAGDWRTNVSLGGRPEPFLPPPGWIDLALRAAACLDAEIAGVDLMPAADGRLLVLEVNGVPGWQGLEAATGGDVAGAVADYLAGKART